MIRSTTVLRQVCIFIVLALALALAACASPPIQTEGTELLETRSAEEQAENTFDVGQTNQVPQLAVEVEITAAGIRPIGVSVVNAPVRVDNSLDEDLLVTIQAGDEVFAEYSIADPRQVEIEGAERAILPEAQTFIYVPFNVELTELVIEPLSPPSTSDESDSTAVRIDLASLFKQVCEQQPDIDECAELGDQPEE